MNNFSWKPHKGPNGEAYVMTGDKGFCYVCNVELTSPQHCRQHVEGSKHMKRENDITHLLANSQTENGLLLNSAQTVLAPQRNVIFNNAGLNRTVYDVLGPGGHCFVCNVVFTSTQLANEHVAGQKHRKKVASQNLLESAGHDSRGVVSFGKSAGFMPTPGLAGDASSRVISAVKTEGSDFYPAEHTSSIVTNSEQPSQLGLRQTGHTPFNVNTSVPVAGHALPGGNYFRPIEEYKLTNVISHTSSVTSGVDRPAQTTSISTETLNPGLVYGYSTSSNVDSGILSGNILPHKAALGQMTRNAASTEIGLVPLPGLLRGPNGESYVMNGDRGYCYVCKLVLTSKAHAQSHLEGKKHKKKNWEQIVNGNSVNMSADGDVSADNIRVLMCKICNVPFSSPENASQHFMSDKHQKKLQSYSAANIQETGPEQTGIVRVHQSPAPIVSQSGESHDNIETDAIPLENAEEQSERLFAPNREFWKGSNTEAYVMKGDRGFCYVCNIELTSPQHCRQHIKGSKHIKKEKEFFSAKSHEAFDPEQTSVMKVYDAAVPITFVKGNSHGLITHTTNEFEIVEPQNRSREQLPPTREMQTRPNTETYVMKGDKGVCYVCNIELTSPQHCRQHIEGSKHIKRKNEFFSVKSHETFDPEQTSVMKVYDAAVPITFVKDNSREFITQTDNKFENAELQSKSEEQLSATREMQIEPNTEACDPLTVLGTFNNSMGSSTLIGSHIMKSLLPSVAMSDITEHEYSNTESQLATHSPEQDIAKHSQALVSSFKNENPRSPLEMYTVHTQPNQSAAISSQTDLGLVVKLETQEQSSSAANNTQTKDVLQNDDLSSQQKDQSKVVNKEIKVNSNDYTDHDDAVCSVTENNQSIAISSKTDLGLVVKLETHEQSSSAVSNTQTKDVLQNDNLSSHQKDRSKVVNKEIVIHSNDYADHENSSITDNTMQPSGGIVATETVENLPLDNKVTNSQQIAQLSVSKASKFPVQSSTQPDEIPHTSHQNSDDPRSSSHHLPDPDTRLLAAVTSGIQDLSHLNNNKINVMANNPVYPVTQPDEIPHTSHQNSDDPRSSSHHRPDRDARLLTAVTSGIQDLSRSNNNRINAVANNSVYSVTQPDEVQQTTPQNSDPLGLQHATYLLNVGSSQTQQPVYVNGSLANSTATKSTPYHFDGSHGYCYCCSIDLTSLQHANQHLHGQKHKKRLEQWELTCAFQNRPILQTQQPPDPQVQQHTKDNSYYFNGDKGFCHVCNIELSSKQHAQQHVNGKPHKRTRERVIKSQNGAVYPLKCQICSKIFTGQESAQQHFTSAKHKSRTDVFNESVVVLNVDDGRVIMKDGQVWHFCDVCKVAMNTREQFLFHRESSKHKRECENPRSSTFSENGPVGISNYIISSNSTSRTSSLPSHSRPSSVETVQDELDTAVIRAMQAKFEDLQFQDEINRQRVLDENRHLLTYGQAPVITRDIPIAGSGQPLMSQNTPLVAGSSQPLTSRDIPVIVGSSQPLSSQVIPKNTSSVATILLNNGSPTMFEGLSRPRYPVTGSISESTIATQQSSVYQTDPEGRSQGRHELTDAHSVPLDYFREQAHFSSLQASSGSSQIYENLWKSLQADGRQNAGLNFNASAHTRGEAGPAHSSAGYANSSNTAGQAAPDHPSGSMQQGVVDISTSLDNLDIIDNTLDSEQNHLNSAAADEFLSNSDNGGSMTAIPRPSRPGKSRGNERIRNVLSMDKKEFDEFDDDYEEENKDDLNIVEVTPEVAVPVAPPEVTPPAAPMRSGKPGFRYYCPICNKHMNTRETYETHIQGKYHVYMVSNQPAPVRNFEPISKVCCDEDELVSRMCEVINKELEIQPRLYQIELVLKAMKADCIIYLPTGTGKTLVAVLTMGLMLQDNPSRPVLFLVDKVLLVMQQAQYIIRHFAGTLFQRRDGDLGSPLVSRVLQVKPICGGMTTKTDVPIWKHDIVVTTAAYCANMLDKGQIRWEDFSLVVLDEVHHCGKGHPYHKLMSTYHCSLPESARAKVLGLTASPAGKSTVDQTYIMLKSLLTNLGGASVAVVEENNVNLDHFQSMAKVKPICVPMSSKEREFKGCLLEYFILCYSQMALMTNNLQTNEPPCSFFLDAFHKPGDREVAARLAEQFIMDPEPLAEVLDVIYKARCIDETDVAGRNRFDNLRLHICELLLIIPEVGSGADIKELLGKLAPSGVTEEFKKMGLPCDQIYQRATRFALDGNNDLTMFSKLVETLQDPDVINWRDTSSRALVLVRERKLAKQYCLKLRAHPMVESMKLRVGHIVGHGKGAKDGGMDVKKQRKVFDNHEKYHILVATSIMEEGIDIQALQLVVCMNPPNSLRALVQMRGRARREGSHFVVLCSSQEDVDKLNSLQKQEQNMQAAAKRCLEESKKCSQNHG
ncbi:hypothetical protein BsWGS_19265 [Bradybaena similaris]